MPDPLAFRERVVSTIDPLVPKPFRVVSATEETAEVTTLWLEPADGLPCLRFQPGQFGMIAVPGVGEVPISFSGDPADRDRLAISVKRVGAITAALTSARPSAILGVRGPLGTAWPLHLADQRRLLVVAGGLGFAPLRSALLTAAASHRPFGMALIYGVRTPKNLLFRWDLERWSARTDIKVFLTVDEVTPGWDWHVGLVTGLFDRALVDPADTVVMMCGPDAMIHAAALDLGNRGVGADRIWVTLERNMKCGVGLCGHCQLGPLILCRDGPVFQYSRVASLARVEEV